MYQNFYRSLQLQQQQAPPPGYICHQCGIPGHWIQQHKQQGMQVGNQKKNNRMPKTQTITQTQSNRSPLQMLHRITQKHNLQPTLLVLSEGLDQQGKVVNKIQIDLDVSHIEGKPEGTVALRQVAWGFSKQDAKKKAVSQMLKHRILKRLASEMKKGNANPGAVPLFGKPKKS